MVVVDASLEFERNRRALVSCASHQSRITHASITHESRIRSHHSRRVSRCLGRVTWARSKPSGGDITRHRKYREA